MAASPVSPSEQEHSTTGAIARGAFWTVLGKFAPMGITIFLTPYIVHGLGVTRYGLFILINSLILLISSLDLGLKGASRRYFAVYAGSNDVAAATRMLVTMLAGLATLGVFISLTGWLVAPLLLDALKMPRSLRPEAVFLFRTLGILLTITFIHTLFSGILQGRHRFALIANAGLACYAVWALGLVATVHFHAGLRGVAIVFLVQQMMLVATLIPPALRYIDWHSVGFLRRRELSELFSFALKSQVNSLAALINTEFDNVIVGSVLSVRTVSFFNTGTNVATNAGSLVLAALTPIQTVLANTFGRGGEKAALVQYRRLARVWSIALTGWFASAAGAAYFAVVAWLGPAFHLAGYIAVVAMISALFMLLRALLAAYCSTVIQMGPSVRAGLVSVAVNIALTVPLLLTGAIGVAIGTAIGQLAGLLYLTWACRRTISPEIPNMLRTIPVWSGMATAGLVAGLEFVCAPWLPSGGLGLIASGVPALVGLAAFAALTLGPTRSLSTLRTAVGTLRTAGPRAAISQVLRLAVQAA